jgi:hypothetical protein
VTPAFNDLLPAVLALFDGRLPLSYRLSFRRWNVPSAGDCFALRAELDEKNGHAVNANLGEVAVFFALGPRERARVLAGAVDFILDRVRQREAHKAALSSGSAFGPSVGAALGGIGASALGAGAGASVDALRAAEMAHARGEMGVDRFAAVPTWNGSVYVWHNPDGSEKHVGQHYHPNGAGVSCRGCLPADHGRRCAASTMGFALCLCSRCKAERGEGPKVVRRVGEPMLARADDATRCGSKGKPHSFAREGTTPVMRCERCGARVEDMLLELGSPYPDEWVPSARRRCALCSFAYEGGDELYCAGCLGQYEAEERLSALVVAGAAHRRQPSAPLGMRLPFFEAVVAAETGRR